MLNWALSEMTRTIYKEWNLDTECKKTALLTILYKPKEKLYYPTVILSKTLKLFHEIIVPDNLSSDANIFAFIKKFITKIKENYDR